MVNKPKYQKFKKESAFKQMRISENDLYAAEVLLTAPKCRPELILFATIKRYTEGDEIIEKKISKQLFS